jgi:hypothetical protein
MGERMRYLVLLAVFLPSIACAADPLRQSDSAASATLPIALSLTAQDLNDLGSNLVMAMRGCTLFPDQQLPPCEQRALQSMTILQQAVNAAQKQPAAEPKK